MGGENREFMLAIGLSALVLILWQLFVGLPTVEQERAKQEAQQPVQQQTQTQTSPDGTVVPTPQAPGGVDSAPMVPGTTAPAASSRAAVIQATARLPIETSKLKGSVNLTGARIDDLLLTQYREKVEKEQPADHAFVAVRHGKSLLCRIRVGGGGGI